MARKGLVDYSKQRDAGPGQDGWAKLKNWKDPMGGASNPLMGNTPLQNGKVNKGRAIGASRGTGIDAPDGMRDSTYGNLNKRGDSTA